MPFTAENFLMSFSLPNFYFHATTAYDILRTRACRWESAISWAGCGSRLERPAFRVA